MSDGATGIDFAQVAEGVDGTERAARPADEPEGPQERLERSVLGGLLALLNADAAPHFATLDAADFTFPRHAAIYRALFALHDREAALTTTAALLELEAQRQPAAYRDPRFIDELARVADTTALVASVAALKEAATRRRVAPDLRGATTAIAQGMPVAVVAEVAQLAADAAREGGGWPPAVPLDEPLSAPFPRDVLRGPLARYAEAIALAYQVPLDVPAALGLGIVSLTLGNRLVVRVRPGWTEGVNLFVAAVMPPASRKSGAVRALMHPVVEWEIAQAERLSREVRETASALSVAEKRLVHAEAKLSKATKREDREAAEEERQRCFDELEVARAELVLAPRLYTDDATPEVLTSLLAMYGGSFGVVTAEGGGVFDMMAGKYSSNGAVNLDVYLKGHAGDTIRVDRKGRPMEYVRHPALTVAVASQPETLRVLAARPELRGRGLPARFLYAIPPSNIGLRDTNPPGLDRAAVDAWSALINGCFELPYDVDDKGQRRAFRLRPDPKAIALIAEFAESVERRLGPNGDLASMPDWGGKLVGAAVRLAAVIHVAERAWAGAERTFWLDPLDADSVERAIYLADAYFVPHARKAFRAMEDTAGVEGARKLLVYLHRRKVASFSTRDALRAIDRNGDRKTVVDPAIDVLLAHGWIRAVEREEGKRGRPAEKYMVHPDALRGTL